MRLTGRRRRAQEERGPRSERRDAILVRTHLIESHEAAEIFITATPSRAGPVREAARDAFGRIHDALRSHRGHILQERIFAGESAMSEVLAARAEAYGSLDDGAPPVRLAVPRGIAGELAGVQVHAVRGARPPSVLKSGGVACGRSVEAGGRRYISLSGLVAPEAGSRTAQARAVFQKADAVLRDVGGDMFSVARTWLWLGDILAWYGDFNEVRNRFFLDCGLLDGSPHQVRLPASTGIGVRPAGGPACALDVFAVVGAEDAIEFFRAAGKQQCAYNYGSAFSRSARVTTPAGKTVYISGTAAIDETGKSRHIDDAKGQIEMTLANVRAALHDMGCTDRDVVQAIAYSKTPEVEKVFLDGWRDIGWPVISAISDICRDELLFEVEATACPGAREAASAR